MVLRLIAAALAQSTALLPRTVIEPRSIVTDVCKKPSMMTVMAMFSTTSAAPPRDDDDNVVLEVAVVDAMPAEA